MTLEKGTGKGTADLAIGLQQPHTVSFSAENATLSASSTKVWHNDALKEGIPTVTASSGWRFTGNWTDEATTYTTDQLKEQVINADDKTFAAEVKKLYSVTYDLNGGTERVLRKPRSMLKREGFAKLYGHQQSEQGREDDLCRLEPGENRGRSSGGCDSRNHRQDHLYGSA